MLFQCWASVEDSVPTLKRLWVNAPCLLRMHLRLKAVSHLGDGGGPGAVDEAACLGSREIAGSSPDLACKLKKENLSSPLTRKDLIL